MGLQSIIDINVDFCDKKYVLINAKQRDKGSRFLSVSCYDCGSVVSLNSGEHSAYIRYRKADGHAVFNSCRINSNGKIIVELTEQMLAVDGLCYADLIIVTGGVAKVDKDTGAILEINGASILSTMTFCIEVSETAVENAELESSFDYSGLNKALEDAKANFKEVIMLAKSYATGEGDGIREGEATDNAKYYSILASENNQNASDSATRAAASAAAARNSEVNAATSASTAAAYSQNADKAATNASNYADKAATSETNAKQHSESAQSSMTSASSSATAASKDASNARYYYDKMSEIMNEYNGVFLPMGTVEFSELAKLVSDGTPKNGFLYNVKDGFVTDDTFKEGAGVEYAAGTNVYYTADDFWDCLSGTAVVGIKGENESVYRIGNVNITADNVGAIPTSSIATVEEVMSFLGI